MERRRFLAGSLKASMLIYGLGGHNLLLGGEQPQTSRPTRRGQRPQRIVETESGDPDLPVEILDISKAPIDELYRGPVTRGIRKEPQIMAQTTLEVAKSFAGVNRSRNPDQVEKFLNLFGLHIRYPNGQVVPYCASGLNFAACQAYCTIAPPQEFEADNPNKTFRTVLPDINKYYFKPSPACRIMVADARSRGTWVERSNVSFEHILPGWLVFFDWKHIGVANHVGIVDRAERSILHTVEFNTSSSEAGNQSNGGAVARRERSFGFVLGFIKTY